MRCSPMRHWQWLRTAPRRQRRSSARLRPQSNARSTAISQCRVRTCRGASKIWKSAPTTAGNATVFPRERAMRVVIIGLGNQGRKRCAVAAADVVATVDPAIADASYSHISEVPLDAYDAALVCTPDDAKIPLLTTLLENRKHVLVEKPIIALDQA